MPKDTRTDPAQEAGGKTAILYRMVMEKHLCPYGRKSKWLLERQGYDVDDRWLTSRDEVDALKAEHGVKTTPQTWIEGSRIGGYEDLQIHFGQKDPDDDGTSYKPVIAIFGTGLGLALAFAWFAGVPFISWQVLGWFISINMVLLGLQKLRDLEAFSTMFLNYDLLAQRWVPYGYVYAFVETGAGLLMTAMALTWLAAPAALFISTIGAISVFKAVYIDKRELKCACVGGNSNVPLGFVSLTENLAMLGMSVVMLGLLFT
ncbi:glutaredoxin-family domain protein [Jannaschia seosinensis]|uniref:Methylamine utilization protein MauE n=1 Tax=Jannaschia seosinensis TaxID=313367 RepID=A0A0M7B5Q9_9RHOB|nr:MauE/DoxX family redox-associated membrane protein [Jannaschia seosinensis]CUH13002.1 glutaredoxin-family domain protein [Jannaschia seosinensis]